MHSTKALIRFLRTLAVATLVLLAVPADAQTQLLHPTYSVWRYQTDLATQQAAGADWVTPGFDDSAWPEGKGLFGNDTGYPYPMNTTIPGLTPIAVYYRSHFTWNGSTAGIVLFGTNYVDDGSIIYLNGVEIARFNMRPEANASTWDIQAPAANPGGYPNVNGGEPVLVRLEIALSSLTNGNPNPLVVGDNVVAVQVHQSGTASSDRVFGLALNAGHIDPCFFDFTQPTNRIILESRSTTFAVVATCLPAPTIQWYRDIGQGEELIIGATGTNYTLTNAKMFDSGQYYAKATNPAGTVTSRQAALRVDHDDIWPTLVSARLGVITTEIIATVDELLCTDSEVCGRNAADWYNWEIFKTDEPGAQLIINTVVVNGLNVLFTLDPSTPWALDTRYTVRPAGLGGDPGGLYDIFGNPMAPDTSAITPPAPGAILVKPVTGSDLYTFDVAPSIFEFSTFIWPGTANGASTVATLDTAVQALDAPLITTRLPELRGNPPGGSGTAGYASDTKNLITRPAGVIGNVIVAHLRNDSGSAQLGLTVTYTLTDRQFGSSEEVPGHLLYYSFSGASNTWSRIFGSFNDGISGSKTGFVYLSGAPWPAGADMYILFADDNAVGTDGIYEIDNFRVSPFPVDPCDSVFPTLARAVGPNNTTVVLTFSKRMAASATNILSYSISGATVTAASLNAAGTEVTLTTTPRAAGNATVTITGLRDSGSCNFLITPNPTTFNLTTVQKVVDWNASWEYNTNNLDATPDWKTTGGTGWLTGNGLFGTETSAAATNAFPTPIATAIPPPNTNNQFLTSYFRKSVNLPALGAGQSYALGYYVDDGAVFYLDNVEIGRFNMPAGAATYLTLSSPALPEGVLRVLPFNASQGSHILSIELHQAGNNNSDTVFGAQVIVIPTVTPSLSITQFGSNAVVSWNTDASWALVGSTNVAGPYDPVAGTPFRRFSRSIATPTTQFYKLNYVPQP